MAHRKKVVLDLERSKHNSVKEIIQIGNEVTVFLTPQQELFCQEYLRLKFNGRQAAIAAGYTKKNAGGIAARLLTNDNVIKYIKELKKDLSRQIGIDAAMIARELAKIGFLNIKHIFDERNVIHDVHSLPDNAAASISAIEVFEELGDADENGNRETIGFTKKIKLYDKVNALTALAKMIGVDGVLKIQPLEPLQDLSQLPIKFK